MPSPDKSTLRATMRAVLAGWDGMSASNRLRGHLRSAAFWKSSRVIYGFFPLRSEPDWLGDGAAGKILAYPRAVADGLRFELASSVIRGPHGAREPSGGAPAPPPDLVLVPGLAFDRAGRRLGRGGGFYDRFLAALPAPRPVLCGVCFAAQIIPEVPTEPHDGRVDWVLTEAGNVACREGA